MKLTRTANAGILLEMQNLRILLDGVCKALPPYLGTPNELRQQLENPYPDIVAFTHGHEDHFDETYAHTYERQTLRSVIGPESFPKEGGQLTFGSLKLTAVPSRHIGKVGELTHVSYIIEGEKCLWFMGDASPLQWRGKALPKPDVLVMPFAYCTNAGAWAATQKIGAEEYVLLHMPDKAQDPYDLWNLVKQTVGNCPQMLCPNMGESFIL